MLKNDLHLLLFHCGAIHIQVIKLSYGTICDSIHEENVSFAHSGMLVSHKKRKSLLSVAPCMNLKETVLHEISQAQKDKKMISAT